MTLAGYFPKITAIPAGCPLPPHVTEVCSVSNCLNGAPDRWVERWLHNELSLFNSVGDARAVAGADERFEVFAYRVLDAYFEDGHRREWVPGPLAVTALPEGYRSIGFDAVSRSAGWAFECSPLSCNMMAGEIPVNQYCLADSVEAAIAMAVRFSQGTVEPGPYYVVEVLRAAAAEIIE